MHIRNLKIRQENAQKRKEIHNSLTVAQKIEKLDKKLGKGIGAAKERKRLTKTPVKITDGVCK